MEFLMEPWALHMAALQPCMAWTPVTPPRCCPRRGRWALTSGRGKSRVPRSEDGTADEARATAGVTSR